MNEYDLISNMSIEIKEEHVPKILEELTDALISIVENYEGFCCGGFDLKLCEYEDSDAMLIIPESKL